VSAYYKMFQNFDVHTKTIIYSLINASKLVTETIWGHHKYITCVSLFIGHTKRRFQHNIIVGKCHSVFTSIAPCPSHIVWNRLTVPRTAVLPYWYYIVLFSYIDIFIFIVLNNYITILQGPIISCEFLSAKQL